MEMCLVGFGFNKEIIIPNQKCAKALRGLCPSDAAKNSSILPRSTNLKMDGAAAVHCAKDAFCHPSWRYR